MRPPSPSKRLSPKKRPRRSPPSWPKLVPKSPSNKTSQAGMQGAASLLLGAGSPQVEVFLGRIRSGVARGAAPCRGPGGSPTLRCPPAFFFSSCTRFAAGETCTRSRIEGVPSKKPPQKGPKHPVLRTYHSEQRKAPRFIAPLSHPCYNANE